jgi:hypothetical protein
MTTVLCIPGAASGTQTDAAKSLGTINQALGGPQALLQQLGDDSQARVVPIAYNDWDPTWGANSGAGALQDALTLLLPDEPAVIFGHSYGAVSAYVWQRTYGPTSHIDPARLQFVLCGNSIRPKTGAMGGTYGAQTPPAKWRNIDIALEFDKWSDAPNNYASPYWWQASNTCNTGDNVGTPNTINGSPNNLHNYGYSRVRLDAPHAETTIGTTRYLLYPTDPMPAGGNGATRAQIASAYQRIVAPTW